MDINNEKYKQKPNSSEGCFVGSYLLLKAAYEITHSYCGPIFNELSKEKFCDSAGSILISTERHCENGERHFEIK